MASLVSPPFYLDNLDGLREKLARAERDDSLLGQVWASVRRRAQAAPENFPWFLPFVALVTGRDEDIEPARQAIRRYVDTFDLSPFGMGLQFHFWCFAFPHARWTLYFQWLQSIGAWEPEEDARLREALITQQFLYFFYGMRSKPEPECVDNQTMALCFSNALIGHLFSDSAVAARMYRDGVRRLPSMLGGMPPSGYSGEGSTYMDHVVGPCIPFLVEFLERAEGGDWFAPPLGPNGGSAEAILRMIAREWMPNGLLLPWDHYGYALPARSAIAYGAHRTGDPLYYALLEQHAGWSHDVGIGWGYDDLVWSLVWWPGERPAAHGPAFPSWAAPEVGAALVSDDTDLYLMQMWDHTTPETPTRAHVNPNALVLAAYGSPLTIDGVPDKDNTAFQYDDTWKALTNMTFTTVRSNFGPGCAGAHGVLLVDGWEGMRANTAYHQSDLVAFDAAAKTVTADVTPLYREHWPDTRMVRRRSTLVAERAWLIEDLARFSAEHQVTARWYLRPTQQAAAQGVCIETAEGVRLHLLPLLGPDGATVRRIDGYPNRLDGASLQVDFHQSGCDCRWLWLAWPEQTRAEALALADGWQVAPDPAGTATLASIRQTMAATELRLPFTRPAFMLADLPLVRSWWYRTVVDLPNAERCWLRLPRQLFNARLWVNGEEIDLAPHALRGQLLPPQVALPAAVCGAAGVEIVVSTACGTRQYAGDGEEGGTGFSGHPAVLVPRAVPALSATYAQEIVSVTYGKHTWRIPYTMMSAEEQEG